MEGFAILLLFRHSTAKNSPLSTHYSAGGGDAGGAGGSSSTLGVAGGSSLTLGWPIVCGFVSCKRWVTPLGLWPFYSLPTIHYSLPGVPHAGLASGVFDFSSGLSISVHSP